MASLERRGQYDAQCPVADSAGVSNIYKINDSYLEIQCATPELIPEVCARRA